MISTVCTSLKCNKIKQATDKSNYRHSMLLKVLFFSCLIKSNVRLNFILFTLNKNVQRVGFRKFLKNTKKKRSHVWLHCVWNSICSKTKIIEIVEAKRDLIKHSIHWKITHRCCTGVFTLLYFVGIKTNSKT